MINFSVEPRMLDNLRNGQALRWLVPHHLLKQILELGREESRSLELPLVELPEEVLLAS